MKLPAYPFHLLVIVAAAATVALILWGLAPSGAHFAAYAGGVGLLAAVDLARRLGLEPKNDPARRDRRETS